MRILVIRRDNIGDLLCTTPLLRALRAQLPAAQIVALVNRYIEPVLRHNPDVDTVHAYQKAKHRASDENRLALYWARAHLLLALRRQRFDWLLLPGGAQSSSALFARWIAPARQLVRDAQDEAAGPHEVEQTCHLLRRMGLEYQTPPLRLAAEPAAQDALAKRIEAQLGFAPRRLIGLHLSARKPSQRWPAERYVELVERFPAHPGDAFVLLWAPGSERNPRHPGDDLKAAEVGARLSQQPLVAVATEHLEDLIAALSLCQRVICPDGGAMHIAAALGKPLVCLFGQSDTARWRPWGVPCELLQPASRDVADVSVDEVLAAEQRLNARPGLV